MTVPIRRPRFGIRARLFLAFGAVGAMTVAACGIAWLAFDHLSGNLGRVTGDSLPAMEIAARLADAGGAVIATAPALAAAESEADRLAAWERLQGLNKAMGELVARMELHARNAGGGGGGFGGVVTAIAENLAGLNDNVASRLELAERSRTLAEMLRWTHADFLDEVEPMIEEARSNMGLIQERARDAGPLSPEARQQLVILQEEARRHDGLMEVSSAGNLVVGLVARTAGLTDREAVEDSRYFMGETADRLRENLKLLEDVPGIVSLRQVSDALLSFAEGTNSIPDLRLEELATLAAGRTLVAANRVLVERLRSFISGQVASVRASTTESATEASRAISGGRILLLLTTALSVLVAVLVAWLYVGRNLIARITGLSRSMRAIAAGNLEAHVPLGGRDEVSEMAEALLVFRNTAIEVENANAQSIIDNAVAGLVTTWDGGEIDSVNPTAVRLFGAPATSLVGRPLTELVDSDSANAVANFFASGAPDAEPDGPGLLLPDAVARRLDGTTVTVDIAIRSFRQRQRRRFIVTIQDVTERVNARELLERRVRERTAELRLANRKLKAEVAERERAEAELVQTAKLAALGQISASIAHELNQPLSAIRSYAHNGRMLLDRGRTEDLRRNLETIESLTERMAQVSQHLKTFARRPAETVGSVELAPVANAALSLFGNRFGHHGIEVRNGIGPGIRVLAEPIRLEQVLVNLIANALDAMNGAGRLTLSAARRGDRVSVSVTDTGVGMDAKTLGHIFDPFFTTKEVGSGLGLGLSISYNIVKDLGGAIAVESAPGRGSTFTITLGFAE